jgi:hypothetical protein
LKYLSNVLSAVLIMRKMTIRFAVIPLLQRPHSNNPDDNSTRRIYTITTTLNFAAFTHNIYQRQSRLHQYEYLQVTSLS